MNICKYLSWRIVCNMVLLGILQWCCLCGAVYSAEDKLFSISLPEDPTPAESTAAKELEHYLNLTVKGRLSVAGETGITFFLGKSGFSGDDKGGLEKLEEEEWLIRSEGKSVLLYGGGRRGTIYAVYHFLEDVIGVHWWNGDEEYIPEPGPVELPALRLHGKSVFTQRKLYRFFRSSIAADGGRWAARNRVNSDGYNMMSAEYGGGVTFGPPYFVHTFTRYFSKEKYFADHPEFFALRNGKRGEGDHPQLCLTNPELKDAFVGKLKEFILLGEEEAEKKGMDAPDIYDISQSDGSKNCECPRCLALKEKTGGYSGPLLALVNGVAREIKSFRPNIKISTLAYLDTELPPENIRAEDNVIVRLCDTRTNQVTSITARENRDFLEVLKKWGTLCPELGIWDYGITFKYTGFPYPSEVALQRTHKAFAENGVKYVFWEVERPEIADMWTLKVWLTAKLMENPDYDASKLYRTFMDKYYGDASILMQKYRSVLFERCREKKSFINWVAEPGDFTYLDAKTVMTSQKLFDMALDAVSEDSVLTERVQRVRLGLDRATYVLFHDLVREWQVAGRNREDFPLERSKIISRARKAWLQSISRLSGEKNRKDYTEEAEAEFKKYGDMSLFPPGVPPTKFARKKVRYFDFTAEKIRIHKECATLVDDADAEAAKAVWLDLENGVGKYTLPMECGAYSPSERKTLAKGHIKAEDVKTPGYNWYRLMTIKPDRSTYVYLLPDWYLQVNVGLPDPAYKGSYQVWASVKFAGPAFPKGKAGDKNGIYVERLVLVPKK